MDAEMLTALHQATQRMADWERRHRTLSVCLTSQQAPNDVATLSGIDAPALNRQSDGGSAVHQMRMRSTSSRLTDSPRRS